MEKRPILSSKAPSPIGPYSQAIECGGFLFCSGQIPLDAATGAIVGQDAASQTEKVMANVLAVLEAANLGFSDVVKTTIFLQSMDDFAAVNEVYAQYFPQNPPARSTVAVRTLPKNVLVEIEVLAKSS